MKTLGEFLNQKIDSNQASINQRLDELLARLPSTSKSAKPKDSGGSINDAQIDNLPLFGLISPGETQYQLNRVPKLNFPRFNGDNPRGWIQKCERYFWLHNIDESRRVDIAAIYLDGKADKWFLNFQVGRNRVTWFEFTHGICIRFENPVEENFIGSFNKLVQINSVEEYFEEFESLKALMLANNPSLSEHYFIISFISGLKEELQNYVAMFYPKSLSIAFSLARMEEQKCHSVAAKNVYPYNSKVVLTNTIKPASTTPIIKRLTQEQMRLRRDKGLCYNCNEIYSLGHKCKGKHQLFMVQTESSDIQDIDVEDEVFEEAVESPVDFDMEISLHALTGTTTAAKLKCKVEHTSHMLVTVVNGEKTGYQFFEDFRLLPLGGCDMVLGADWLNKLGDVMFNFSKLSVSFAHHGPNITLQRITNSPSLLMMSGSDIFDEPTSLPPHRTLDHSIPLKPDSQPPNQRPYRCPYIQKGVVEQLVKEMLSSNSSDPMDIYKTAFRTHHGHYEFKVMPFGLTNAPATFQTLMNEVFGPYLRKFVFVFFDDILVYGSSMSEHIEHLRIVFSLLRQHKLYAKLSKCCFGQSQLDYLGHIITPAGVCVDPDKIVAIQNWPIPTSIKELRGFLGLTRYYRKFVKNDGAICKPLTDLLRKNSFNWNAVSTSAFEQLKLAMSSTPVLALPDFSKPFTVESDATEHCLGAVLSQEGKPISFFSSPLGPRARAFSTYEKEFLAIVKAVQKWRHYLLGIKFIIQTDHHSIRYFLEQNITTVLQQK
ncbi:uncharacterized protein LOC113324426 [Papaver somniferum]|uniref:uncharacterized protein LOC113324426 n=1 Tax=Papaver somniferum TaxID=3469 RepID=UPI000E702106|nr:uncharacterized protein LOC113324426 [Papaver somniferum]